MNIETTGLLIFLATLLAILLSLSVILRRKEPPKKNRITAGPQQKLRTCPLCKTPLNPGERVKAILYPPAPQTGERMQEIQGCPHCYPPKAKPDRLCPVCKNRVPDDGWVIARVFQKPGKTHVHVLGCTDCYKNPIRRT